MHLTPEDADRGLYLDLKGVRGAPPALLGVAVDGGFEAVVVDTRFGDAALARDLRVGHLEDEIGAVLARSHGEARPVVAFASVELELLDEHTSLGAELAPVFVAAGDLADAWRRRARDIPARFRLPARPALDDLLAAVDQPRSRRWDPSHTTPRLRYVEQQLQRHGAFDRITATAKAKWTRLLQHCEADARGLCGLTRELARRLAELPAADADGDGS